MTRPSSWTLASRAALSFTLVAAVLTVRASAQNAALFVAAEQGDVQAIERLAKAGADVNVVGELRYGDRSYRVSAVGAAALAWHADAARALLKFGASPPQYVVRNHNLLPFSDRELDALRDWEVINSILRIPEVAAITHQIVERDAQGTYRTHDGREYAVAFDSEGLQLSAPSAAPLRFQLVVGRAFIQRLPTSTAPSGGPRERTATDLEMFGRFVEPLPEADRAALVAQFRDRGAAWLEFVVGEGRVLALEIREAAPPAWAERLSSSAGLESAPRPRRF